MIYYTCQVLGTAQLVPVRHDVIPTMCGLLLQSRETQGFALVWRASPFTKEEGHRLVSSVYTTQLCNHTLVLICNIIYEGGVYIILLCMWKAMPAVVRRHQGVFQMRHDDNCRVGRRESNAMGRAVSYRIPLGRIKKKTSLLPLPVASRC